MTKYLAHVCYMLGYKRHSMPRLVRRFAARNALHRAWLAGKCGFFVEDGVSYGPAQPYGIAR